MDGEIAPDATIGYEYHEDAGETQIGDDAVIRSGSTVYGDVTIGDGFATGHDVVIREHTEIGDDVLVGTHTVIDGSTTIGSSTSLQTGVYVPSHTTIGDAAFLGPRAVLTNDRYPVRDEDDLVGPTIEDDVTVGANATVLPDVTVGRGSFVAAGAIVTQDVPPDTLAVGTPARHEPLPARLQGGNLLP